MVIVVATLLSGCASTPSPSPPRSTPSGYPIASPSSGAYGYLVRYAIAFCHEQEPLLDEAAKSYADSHIVAAVEAGTTKVSGQLFYVEFTNSCTQGLRITSSNPHVGQVRCIFYASDKQPVVVEIYMLSPGTDTLIGTRANGTRTTVVITYL